MADSTNPNAKKSKSSDFLPRFYRTDANKKFLQATIDQLIQPGTVKKINGFIGRENAKSTTGTDIFLDAPTQIRKDYQFEPGIVIKDTLGNTTLFKDYQDYINQIGVFGGNTKNHNRINQQEFYSWDPHINWDKFVNFQQYYWLPYGPDVIKIAGKAEEIDSVYTVVIDPQGDNNTYLFSPDGLTRNPAIKLFRGQTYTFEINSPGNPFSIKTARTSGTGYRYNIPGIDNQGVTDGTITFTVPYSAPDLLYYVSEFDIDLGGVFEILSIDENSSIDVELEILGKKAYTLQDGTALSNGMKVSFIGRVVPEQYSVGEFYVEGVGDAIKLVNTKDLELISAYTTSEAVLFDTTPFDNMPFSDATAFAGTPDYVVINRSSKDRNPWSRYNRWFHKDVIDASAKYNGKISEYDQTLRAVRPIIEFEEDLRLSNFGTQAVQDVDLVDSYTTDVFSTIEGALGYNIDGVDLAQGQRILFTADTDILVKDKIFKVEFLTLAGVRQLHLIEEDNPVQYNTVLVKQGVLNQGQMYWYNGSEWKLAQQKTQLNQPPLYDVVDASGNSYSDITVYDGTTFAGTKVFSYKVGSGTSDPTMGFPLSYKNISNIGDIVFNFNLVTDTFQYKDVTNVIDVTLNVGYLVKTNKNGDISYKNGWQTANVAKAQPALRVYKNSTLVNNFDLDIFDDKNDLADLVVRVYVNGIRLDSDKWSIVDGSVYKKIVLVTDISTTDVLTIKAFTKQPINDTGKYELPINLQNNPLNVEIGDFTLGEVIDHVNSIVDGLSNFSGTFPGKSNIRDLGNVTQYGTKFVQHSGPLSLALYHLTSEDNNIVRAIEKARDDYNKFKRNFVATAGTLGVDADASILVDLILQKINKDKPKNAPYYFSDMVPTGAKTVTELTVLDYRIKTYPLSSAFSLNELSNKAVLIYVNGRQLLHEHDYEFDGMGFVVISAELNNDDIIEVHEYDNTNGSFIPATPTKLGIWPSWDPAMYVDNSYITPRTVIRGHDGSIVLAYGDYRDDLILELEKRIYNNIKMSYDPSIFDVTDFMPGYFRDTPYSLTEFNEVLASSFYKWTSLVNRDFTKPLSYDRANSLTYNYDTMAAPDGRAVPGYWRGIYRWMLDTDAPNITPWQMLGFNDMPAWWAEVYGPAPYTSDNLPLWEDLANGVVRQPGKPLEVREEFKRPFLINSIPVDENGNVRSPYDSGMVSGTITQATNGDFVFGDCSPIENAWRRSSHYSFGVLITAMLLHPAKTFGLCLDRSRVIRNIAGQLVYKDTGLRIAPDNIKLPSIYSSTEVIRTSGIINYIVDYILSDNLRSYDEYLYNLANMDAKLSYRVGGFTSKEKFKLLLDSKSPLSSGSVFVPQEDYDIILNSSNPIKKITYSGVIITKLSDGFEIKGYSRTQPYFKYYAWTQSGITINVGGISESYSQWTASSQYAAGKIVNYNGKYYRVKVLHTTTSIFDIAFYQPLSELPIIGGKTATLRKLWDREDPIVVPYGTKFRTIQEVVDFLLGYGEYLKDQGFIFDDFNNELAAVTNWETSAKEFLFWTTQNWSTGEDKWKEWLPQTEVKFEEIVRYNGDYYKAIRNSAPSDVFDAENYVKLDGLSTVGSSVISLSPAATKLVFSTPLSVVDDIRNSFNGYEIFKVDGSPLTPNFINSYREENAVSYTPQGEDGIYGASFFLVQKEQVVIINNTTMFNDTIYSPATGYRQERVKVAGYVSTNWYGGFDVPGFIFDQARISEWNQWTDYALGDIVKHKEFYYTAGLFIAGAETFDNTAWVKLDSKPTPKLLPNWSYKAEQFTDFYSLDSDNFDPDQQAMAQHLVGYQKRQYLSNIIQDDVSEFKFYQGMIVEKGTQNVLNKLFDVLSATDKESLTFYEEWALRVGRYGASSAYENIEFVLDESLFKINPQGIELVTNKQDTNDFIIRQTPNDVYLKPVGYNSNPWPTISNPVSYLRTPGHVRQSEVKLVVGTPDDIVGKDISTFKVGDYIWAGFDGPSWNVYRVSDADLKVLAITYDGSLNELIVETTAIVKIPVGSIVGLTQTVDGSVGFDGFYKVKSKHLNTLVLSATLTNWSDFSNQDSIVVTVLTQQKADSIDNIETVLPKTILKNELVWTGGSGTAEKWRTWTYDPAYTSSTIANSYPVEDLRYGRSVTLSKEGTIALVATSAGEINVFDKASINSVWLQRQVIQAPSFNANTNLGELTGDVVAVSADGRWLATGTPLASYVTSNFVGDMELIHDPYPAGSIVRAGTIENPEYYQAVIDTYGEVEINSAHWKRVPYIPADMTAPASTKLEQGVITIYEKDSENLYNLVDTIVSPYPADGEHFGSNLVFGKDTLFVSAGGYDDLDGKLYQLSYLTTTYATAYYNPVGSSETTIKLTNVVGTIEEGMTLQGTGFSDQIVASYDAETNTVIISDVPDTDPTGVIEFVQTSWEYDTSSGRRIKGQVGSSESFGKSLATNYDGSILAVGAHKGNKVYVYENQPTTDEPKKYVQIDVIDVNDGADVNSNFGGSVTVSDDGNYIAVSSVLSDGIEVDQGKVTVYVYTNGKYKEKQPLKVRNPELSQAFGTKVSFMNNYETLVVFSATGDSNIPWELTDGVTFDEGTTTFSLYKNVDSGRVDIYDMYDTDWVYSESLELNNKFTEKYGSGIAVGNNSVLVGAPYATDGQVVSGQVYEYRKSPGRKAWTILHQESERIDAKKVKKAFLYNKRSNEFVAYLDVLDISQGKIPGPADQEIKYKTFYDPATYSVGNSSVNVDDGQAWTKSQVGMLWWDLRTAKFIESYDTDPVYRNSTWNSMFPNASIDVYEWVETTYLPSAWNSLADTEEGIALGISGTSLYTDSVYSVVRRYDNVSKTFKNTYYYWVKNKKTIPNIPHRAMSAQDVSTLIENPRGSGYKYLALTSTGSFSLVNVKPVLHDKDIVLSVEYWITDNVTQNIHSQWKLVNTNEVTNIPSNIEQKWFDSLCGKDTQGRDVPDANLPVKLKYGVENRPRQSMFINRFEALKQFVEQVNRLLITEQVVGQRDISDLESYDIAPSTISGLYDDVKDTDVELKFANINTFKKPILNPVIENGRIVSVEILDRGNGYLIAPTITIAGQGEGAILKTTINNAGKLSSVIVENEGYGYSSATTSLFVRNYAVLVLQDTQASNAWSIYEYDTDTKVWSRVQSQNYDTRRYWSYADWYATGFNQFTAPNFSVATLVDLNTVTPAVGETVLVRTNNSSYWTLLRKYANSTSVDWTQSYEIVGLQNGTIQLATTLYNFKNTTYGYDGALYDGGIFDNSASVELRTILNTLKDKILVDTLKEEYLKLFFTTVRYAFSEQGYVDWAFKTSFVKAKHNVGELHQAVTYENDNLKDFESYVSEVKPYRTKIREYISAYDKVDNASLTATDFDLPPVYSDVDGKVVPIQSVITSNGIVFDNSAITEYPWKHWYDNLGFKVTELRLVDGGSGYGSEPVVRFEGLTGTGAKARAFISNGKVNRIVLLNQGSGYLSAPVVTLDGGLQDGGIPARVVAVIGDGVVRSNLIKMKFDRITQKYFITYLQETETWSGDSQVSGSRVQFPLVWGPDVRIGKSTVTVNGVEILRDNYKLAIVKSTVRGYTSYSGSITFDTPPTKGATVVVTYIKDWSLLNAADRIQYYYDPATGELGKDLAQLMEGVDYGGVIINGLGFDVSSGWDSLPYYNDKWDSFDSTFDDFIESIGITTDTDFQLPYVPEDGTELNIYRVPFNSESYVSDGEKLIYEFNINDVSPKVTVTRDAITAGVITGYVGNIDLTLVVDDTSDIVEGMSIFGPGFTSGQTVTGVIDGTTLTISAVPNVTPGIGADIEFTFNKSGINILTVDSTTGIAVGDTLTITPIVTNTLGYNTVVTQIISATQVKLDQILFKEIPVGSTATFTRELTEPTNCTINANGTVYLKEPITLGSTLTISSLVDPIRIDDPNFGTPDQTNENAVMSTVIGDGVTDIVIVPDGIFLPGDRIIIRKSTSDGSIKPAETDYDTALNGGDWAYSTATGLRAEDILVDGDGFVTPTSSPATEEVVPGQVVDAVAIKVYDKPSSGAANIKVDSYIADGVTTEFALSMMPNSPQAIIVKITEGSRDLSTDELTSVATIKTINDDYIVDYKTQSIKFDVAPTAGQLVSIFILGFNGSNILDLDYFIGDGVTTEFITKAPWLENLNYIIYINGISVPELAPGLFKTDSTYEIANQVGIKFGQAPEVGDLINYVIVSGTEQTYAITKTERIVANGIDTTYDLQYPIGDSLPVEAYMIVRVDQEILKGPINSYFTITGNKVNYTLDPKKFAPYSLSITDLVILADGNTLNPGTDYTIDMGGITVKISQAVRKAYLGKALIVSVRQNRGYTYIPSVGGNGPQISFAEVYDNTRLIEVISSYKHDILDIQRTGVTVTANLAVTPDTVEYYSYKSLANGKLELDRSVINDNYIWVIKNNTLLTPSVDFKLNTDRKSISLALPPDQLDEITLMTFGSNILTSGIAYMQFKDMLNRVIFKRLSINKQTRLVKDLRYSDTTIEVADASAFDLPNPQRNKPGIIEIRGERIEFFTINGNVLGQLRRGTLGTGTPIVHKAGAFVQDIGPSETLPYSENSVIENIISDGTNVIPLNFIPTKSESVWKYEDGYVSSIPSNYGQGDDIEVFVGGYTSVDWAPNVSYDVNDVVNVGTYTFRCVTAHTSSTTFEADRTTNWTFFIGNIRLKKSPYKVHNVNNHPESPEGDVQLDAEFAVDGESKEIRLTNLLEFGTRVTVIKRTGADWDGKGTPNIQYDSTKIAQFLKATPGIWYSSIDKYENTASSAGTFDSTSGTFDNTSTTFDQG